MTPKAIQTVAFNALTLLGITLLALLISHYISNERTFQAQQIVLKERYGTVFPAHTFRSMRISDPDTYEDISAAYIAYDEQALVRGYIVEIVLEEADETFEIAIAYSWDARTVEGVFLLNRSNNPNAEPDVDFFRQFAGAQAPVALIADLPREVSGVEEYDPIEGLIDGLYRATMERQAADGYTDYVTMIVQGGRIVHVTWDATAPDGGKNRVQASVDGEYVLSGDQGLWAAQAHAIQKKLIEVQDPDRIGIKSDGTTDVVDGVHISGSFFVRMVNQCIADAKKGNVYVPEQGEVVMRVQEDETSETKVEQPSDLPGRRDISDPSYLVGSEDGVIIHGDEEDILDKLAGFSVAEIRTAIQEDQQDMLLSRATAKGVNFSYAYLSFETGGIIF